MSTSYYLRNKKDYEEYKNYLNFLEKLKVDTNQKIKPQDYALDFYWPFMK